jgi:hypothetical protein
MNELQINKILRRHPRTRGVFIRCAPADKIPITDYYPYAAVLNTDKSSRSGQHWVAVYVPSKDVVEYFDSYGDLPNEDIASYLCRYPEVKRSIQPLQSLFSNVCGQFCIYFVIQRCLGRRYEDIIRLLRRLKDPDKYVAQYVLRSL